MKNPDPKERRFLGRVVGIRGGGLYEVSLAVPPENDDASTPTPPSQFVARGELVRLPPKFRNAVWIKRGSFALIEMEESKTKVAGQIAYILRPEHVKDFRAQGLWPSQLFDAELTVAKPKETKEEEASDGDDDLFVNRNRRYAESDDDDEDEEEGEEEAVDATGDEEGQDAAVDDATDQLD
ncbi:hypothetical protein HDU96_010224 [Phlyctochytrium bullatum]|nr:hypothetical protein HDU96_010224 [Phlyctochytrium bullatum]